jgi:ribosomal protein S27AE
MPYIKSFEAGQIRELRGVSCPRCVMQKSMKHRARLDCGRCTCRPPKVKQSETTRLIVYTYLTCVFCVLVSDSARDGDMRK